MTAFTKEQINTLIPNSILYESIKSLCSKYVRKLKKKMIVLGIQTPRIYLPIAWSLSSFTLIVVIISMLTLSLANAKPKHGILYSTYSSKPYVLGASTNNIISDDPRAAKIEMIFEKYNCPIQGYGKAFVIEADKNNIPYWLVASVAFQESSCGKMTPKKDGVETHNLYGWGVWGDNVKEFDSVEHGIQVVSKYMSDNFFSKGITKPCEIMKIYTPPSKGSWCSGVEFFRNEIDNYNSPN